MPSPGPRPLAAALAGATLFAASCFQAPAVDGLYRCTTQQTCPDPYVCDDGVCCTPGPGGVPECPGYVGQDGKCSDGGTPRAYFQDLDEDGYGADGTDRLACRAPASYHFALDGGDCNDVPAAGGASVYPGGPEQCDGLDNNCNGVRDEGFQLTTFWRDQDGDSYGDPAGTVQACQLPLGYVANSADCQPERNDAHPGATEVCNGVDDDCNRTTDDIPDRGQPCTDGTRQGICQAGTWQCSAAAKVCQQSVQPQPVDLCDGQDNDCDGVPDERPDCGGPSSLVLEPGVVVGAKKLAVAWFTSGAPPRCLRDDPADNPGTSGAPPDTSVQATGEWTGYWATTHVFWAQAPAGKTWDLRQSGKAFRIAGGVELSSNNAGSTYVWHPPTQPWIMLCGPAGFIRLARSPTLFSLTNQVWSTYDESFPVRGGGSWSIQSGSSTNVDAVLQRVEHVEILVEPEPASGGAWFRLDFGEARMGLQ